jgi:hypothetical protein
MVITFVGGSVSEDAMTTAARLLKWQSIQSSNGPIRNQSYKDLIKKDHLHTRRLNLGIGFVFYTEAHSQPK